MTIETKLLALRDVIQTDVGNRGLASDPATNLFNACPDDFALTCQRLAWADDPVLAIVTGFLIPSSPTPAFETDGPLGALFLSRACQAMKISAPIFTDSGCVRAIDAGRRMVEIDPETVWEIPQRRAEVAAFWPVDHLAVSHVLAIERVGPAADGQCYTMRGRNITEQMAPAEILFAREFRPLHLPLHTATAERLVTIGIGDGGNEIGMGKIPHETMVKNIPNGDLIHCRVATDLLVVAGVSNWGAYAVAAGIALLRGFPLPAAFFDPDRERAILKSMVDDGPLIDGVTGKNTATVDGLSWDAYIRPLIEIGKILGI